MIILISYRVINNCRNFYSEGQRFNRKRKQELGDDLSVCVLNIVLKTSSLPSLLTVNLTKVEIQISQTVTRPHVGHFIKGSCLGASYTKSAPCLVWYPQIFCRWKYVLICHVSPQNHCTEVLCSSQQVTTLKSFVVIGILIVNTKNASSKIWIL